MIILNKKLLKIIILLLPITIISFFKKETNFYVEEPDIEVNVIHNDEELNIDLESYVLGVVAAEMPASFELEALKAQAIASRTYVINHLNNHTTITSTINDQAYIGEEEMRKKWQDEYDKYYEKIKIAVDETEGLVIKYDNEPIKAYYYSMSNGYTESSFNVFNEQNDYLNVVESNWDADNEKEIEISKEEFCNKLTITCEEIKIDNITKDDSNRVATIDINSKRFTGIEVRQLLSLRSTDFTITVEDQVVKILTKGYGHGVGMSQYGANNMAIEGYSCEEILKYYYQNTEISNI